MGTQRWDCETALNGKGQRLPEAPSHVFWTPNMPKVLVLTQSWMLLPLSEHALGTNHLLVLPCGFLSATSRPRLAREKGKEKSRDVFVFVQWEGIGGRDVRCGVVQRWNDLRSCGLCREIPGAGTCP